DEHVEVRSAVATAIVAIAGPDEPVVRTFMDMLKSDSEDLRAEGAERLGRLGKPAWIAVPALEELLNDPEESVRRSAAYALSLLGPASRAAVRSLIAALKESHCGGCFWMPDGYDAFQRIGPECLPDLVDALLTDDDPDIRQHVVEVLAEFGPGSSMGVP